MEQRFKFQNAELIFLFFNFYFQFFLNLMLVAIESPSTSNVCTCLTFTQLIVKFSFLCFSLHQAEMFSCESNSIFEIYGMLNKSSRIRKWIQFVRTHVHKYLDEWAGGLVQSDGIYMLQGKIPRIISKYGSALSSRSGALRFFSMRIYRSHITYVYQHHWKFHLFFQPKK